MTDHWKGLTDDEASALVKEHGITELDAETFTFLLGDGSRLHIAYERAGYEHLAAEHARDWRETLADRADAKAMVDAS